MGHLPVLIIGGGIAGLSVAGTLIDNGIPCVIVEKSHDVGGHVRKWACMATDRCQKCFCCLIEDLVRGVSSSDLAEVMTGWELSSFLSSNGGGKLVRLKKASSEDEVDVSASAIVVATGFEPYDPTEKALWGYGRLDGVYTLAQMNTILREDKLPLFVGEADELRIAFFQCVGSRDAGIGANYCSQYCCKAALRMALKLFHHCPGADVTIFYIDLQVAGKYAGELLRKAQQSGVHLRQGVPGEIEQGPENCLEVVVEHKGRNVREHFDRVILSIGQGPAPETSTFTGILGLAADRGYLRPKHVLDSSRTEVPGTYVCGTCCGPKDIEQTLEHAGQTAAALIVDLHRGVLS